MDKLCKAILEKFSETAINSTSEFICAYLPDFKNDCSTDAKTVAASLGVSMSYAVDAIDYLVVDGYLERLYVDKSDGEKIVIGVKLTHKGKHYKYFERQKVKAYIAEKWIDFFALILSVGALAISITALLLEH